MMQEKHLFEYAVIRIVPCVEEEFINTGIILYCASEKFLQLVYKLNETKLKAFSTEINLAEIDQRLKAFEHIAKGEKTGGTIAALPLASRFRWLASTKSTVIQKPSPVHPGLVYRSLRNHMMKLFEQMIL